MSSEQRVWDIPFGPLFGEVHNTLTAPCPLADHRINRRECQNRKFDAALDGYVQRFTSRPGSASVVSLLGGLLCPHWRTAIFRWVSTALRRSAPNWNCTVPSGVFLSQRRRLISRFVLRA
jgi:hypothetical protein